MVIDVGSVKASAIAAIEPKLAPGAYVACHPVAGIERVGPDAASPLLFEGKRCVICPTPLSREESVAVIERLWIAMGAEPVRMDAALHDRVLGAGSHLPHVAAYTLAATLGGSRRDVIEGLQRLPTSSLRDTTRVAASSPVMWRDIFLDNREEVLPLVDALARQIEALRAAIEAGDGARIGELLEAAKAGRERLGSGLAAMNPTPASRGSSRGVFPRSRARSSCSAGPPGPLRPSPPPAAATSFDAAPATPASPSGPRAAADDSDLWNLAPASSDALAEVDLGALRASPWSRALDQSGFSGQREEGRRLFGYDIFAEGERLLSVMTEAGGVPRTLTIVRGTFDPARVGAAFVASTPGATETRWRDSPLWEGGGRAVALVTPRTLVQGEPDAVRGAIDAAWGLVPDARTVPLGALRRSLDADHAGPAAFVALNVTDGMRARAAGFVDLPPGLAICRRTPRPGRRSQPGRHRRARQRPRRRRRGRGLEPGDSCSTASTRWSGCSASGRCWTESSSASRGCGCTATCGSRSSAARGWPRSCWPSCRWSPPRATDLVVVNPAMSTSLRVRRSGPLRGTCRVPGDKSISHRALLFGALTDGVVEARGLGQGGDNLSTAAALRALGVDVEIEEGNARIVGVGFAGLRAAAEALDCGNSGTTIRLLLGLLAGRPLVVVDGRHSRLDNDVGGAIPAQSAQEFAAQQDCRRNQ